MILGYPNLQKCCIVAENSICDGTIIEIQSDSCNIADKYADYHTCGEVPRLNENGHQNYETSYRVVHKNNFTDSPKNVVTHSYHNVLLFYPFLSVGHRRGHVAF